MRFFPALAVALLPFVAVAQTDEWVRDDMTDESLWLVRTGNLALEPSTAGVFPGAPERGSQWVVSKGDGPAYVVYFLPGPIHEVEIDTHRLAGAAGDFTLAVSTDGKLYQPINAGSVLLDSSFGWDYRLMASDQIPENATHLLVQFPNGSSAHRLSEVWIRYTWDDALVNRFLPAPAAAPPAQGEFSLQSDADLQLLLDQLMAQQRKDPTPSVDPLDMFAQAEPPGTPELQASFTTTTPFEYAPAIAQPEAMPVVEDVEEEENVEATEPALAIGETTQPESVETKEAEDEAGTAPGAPTVADESTPAIVANVPDAVNETSVVNPELVTDTAIDDPAVAGVAAVTEEAGLPADSQVDAENADSQEQPIALAAGLLDASISQTTSPEPGTTEINISEFSPRAESDTGVFTAESTADIEKPNATSTHLIESVSPEVVPSQPGESEIDVAEFSPDVGAIPSLEMIAGTSEASESIEIEPLAIAATDSQSNATDETLPTTESAPVIEEAQPVAIELAANPGLEPAPAPESVSVETTPTAIDFTEVAVAEFGAAAAAATELTAPAFAMPSEEATPTFGPSRLALADADGPTVPAVEVASPEPTPPELAPAPAAVAETEKDIVENPPPITQVDGPPPIAVSQPDLAVVESRLETPEQGDPIDPSAFADPEVEVEVAAVSPEVIAESPTADVTAEEPEQVWRLPPFDLPIMSASQAREIAASNEGPVSSQTESPIVAQEPPPSETVHASVPEIAAAPIAVDPVATMESEAPAAEPEVAALETSPAAPSDSGPMLIAPAEAPAVDAPDPKISDDPEPDRKPTMKVRRIGPRSKSRDSYSARG